MTRKTFRTPRSKNKIENARVGYQAVVNLWINESQLIWARFSSMVLVNSIFIAGIIIVLTSKFNLIFLTVPLSFAGIVICIILLLVSNRSWNYHRYYILSARELEMNYLYPIKTSSRGVNFSEGKKVQFNFRGNLENFQMSFCSRLMKVKGFSYIVTFVFISVYVIIILFSLYQLDFILIDIKSLIQNIICSYYLG